MVGAVAAYTGVTLHVLVAMNPVSLLDLPLPLDLLLYIPV